MALVTIDNTFEDATTDVESLKDKQKQFEQIAKEVAILAGKIVLKLRQQDSEIDQNWSFIDGGENHNSSNDTRDIN